MNTKKVLIAVYSILIGILSLFILILSFKAIPLDIIIDNISVIYNNFDYLILVAIVAVLFFVASICIFHITVSKKKASPSITTFNEYGVIRISIDVIKNLSLKAARQIRGVKEVKSHITFKDEDGLYVNISLKALPEVDIPSVSSQVQKEVKEYVEKYAGVSIKEIRVYVQDIFYSGTRVE